MLFELTNSTTPLASRSMSEYIGVKIDVDPDVVDRVIMSFWSHYFDPIHFMDGELQVHVPFVGRFSLFRRTGGNVGVAMQQVDARTLAAAPARIEQMRNEDWVSDHETSGVFPIDERHAAARVAVAASEDNDLDLSTTYKIVLELMALVATLLSLASRRIRFPSVGEMYPTTGPRGSRIYKFRVYKDLLRNLASIPLEKYIALARDSRESSDVRVRSRRKQKSSQTGAWGCLGVIGLVLFLVFSFNNGCRDQIRLFDATRDIHPGHHANLRMSYDAVPTHSPQEPLHVTLLDNPRFTALPVGPVR